jgi:type IX secretion system PorP/SprF family membrane protein
MRNFSKISLLFWAIVIVNGLCAQQISQPTNFVFNYQIVNPASTGYTNCTEFKTCHRRQWAGFKGAPINSTAMIHARMRPNKNTFQGIGAFVESDQAGAFGMTALTMNYAFHTRISKGYNLAAGIGVGFSQYRIDFTKLNFKDSENEQAITNSVADYVIPNINMGFWLYRGDRFYGLSIRSLRGSKIDGTQDSRYNRHYAITYGKYIKLNKVYSFRPSFMFRWVKSTRPALDAQLLMSYKKRFAIGLGVRNGSGFSAMVKIDLLDQITVWYAYDLSVNKMRYAAYSTHEISLGIRTCAVLGKDNGLCAAYD